jgi:hypothetical protein
MFRQFGVGLPESPEHKRLKFFLRDNPSIIGVSYRILNRGVEYRFPSLDEVDVRFCGAKHAHFVEVKSRISSELDLRRGVFQCVKYRAIAEAIEDARIEGGAGREVAVALVVERTNLPINVAVLARKLSVPIIPVNSKKVERWGKSHDQWRN